MDKQEKKEKKELITAVKYSDMPVDCRNKLVELIKEYYMKKLK